MSSGRTRLVLALVGVAMACPPEVVAQEGAADAFLDGTAAELLASARARRSVVNDSITAYGAVVKERISAGFSAFRRDRLVYRREIASRIRWRREGPIDVEVLGAREAVPIALEGVQVPNGLAGEVGHLAFDPASDELLVGLGEDDEAFVHHPFVEGSEADYRFSTGDTTRIRLPDGREIRLYELRVHPRRDDFDLVTGSFWLEAETRDVVRAVYRPARPFDMDRDLIGMVEAQDSLEAEEVEEGLDKVPGLLKPIQLRVRYITMESGLWELRWWLPRVLSLEAEVSVARLLKMPFRYERSYGGYAVSALEADAGSGMLDAYPLKVVADSVAGDSATAVAPAVAPAGAAGWEDLLADDWKGRRCQPREGLTCTCDDGRCRYVAVTMPEDTASLLTSAELPGSIFASGEQLLTGTELEDLEERLGSLLDPPWRLAAPGLAWGWGAPGLLRYNRIEGLSVGARAESDFGPLTADLTARLGTADLEPNFELGATRVTSGGEYRLAAYRRLEVAQEDVRALGIGNSLSALAFGVDDGEYYRSLGVELEGEPVGWSWVSWDWRLFAERQSRAAVETDFSLLGGDEPFRPNLVADRADLAGADVALRFERGLDATGFRWGGGLEVEAAAGDFRYVRPSVGAHVTTSLPFDLVGAVEAEIGTSLGDLPAQRRWYLGGPGSVRGYSGAAAVGAAFWRGRAEIANDFPAARVSLFGDIGWAGERDAFRDGRPLLGAGVGGSFLDGLIRMDLARALRAPEGWRFSIYVDGIL